MKAPQTQKPEGGSFLNWPICTEWTDLKADAVMFGVPYGKPYMPQDTFNDQSRAPQALRAASSRILIGPEMVNMDCVPPRGLENLHLVDGGDIPLPDGDVDSHYQQAEAAVRFAISRGIIPVSVGGDDGITNPVIRGLDGLDDITLVQIDAHMDWRDERYGERDGYSSPMRRASELAHITGIHQVGIRSFGSAREEEIRAATQWGACIHLARDIARNGIGPVIDALPDGGRFFVTLDADGLDPSVMPGVVALAPGGLNWWHMIDLFEGMAKKGRIIGLNIVELSPANDVNQLSMIGAGRLLLNLLMRQLLR